MATQYPNSGKLAPNKYKDGNPKKPDHTGELVMTRTTLKELMEEHDGDDIVIKLSCWNMEGQWGAWQRISWNNYKPEPKENPYTRPAPKKAEPVYEEIEDKDIPF